MRPQQLVEKLTPIHGALGHIISCVCYQYLQRIPWWDLSARIFGWWTRVKYRAVLKVCGELHRHLSLRIADALHAEDDSSILYDDHLEHVVTTAEKIISIYSAGMGQPRA